MYYSSPYDVDYWHSLVDLHTGLFWEAYWYLQGVHYQDIVCLDTYFLCYISDYSLTKSSITSTLLQLQ